MKTFKKRQKRTMCIVCVILTIYVQMLDVLPYIISTLHIDETLRVVSGKKRVSLLKTLLLLRAEGGLN